MDSDESLRHRVAAGEKQALTRGRWTGKPGRFLPSPFAVKLPRMTPPSAREKECVDAAIAIVVRNGQVLVAQRKQDDVLGGYWEFPGGKCEEGETLEQCLHRELREELDIRAEPLQRLAAIEHDYPHSLVRLHPFICRHVEGEAKFLECQDARWIDPTLLRDYSFPPANEQLIDQVVSLLTRPQ